MKPVDVAVIGAGPAGLAAATLTAELGLDAVVFEQRSETGGVMYRRIANLPAALAAKLAFARARGDALQSALTRSGAQVAVESTVQGVDATTDGFAVSASIAGVRTVVSARTVILATGAIERPMAIPGSTLPGVIGALGAHTRLADSGTAPEGRIVLAGCGPLLYLVAQELRVAGANVAAVLDALSVDRFVRALPFAIDFMRSPYYKRGAALLTDINENIPIYHDVVELAALGNERLASVRFSANKRSVTLVADQLLLHLGLMPDVQLARVAGCALRWDRRNAWQVPVLDAWGASSIAKLFVAGDAVAIGGAAAAEHRGRLAALAAAAALGRMDVAARDAASRPHRAALAKALRGRRFLDTVYRPPERFCLPDGDPASTSQP